MKHIICIRGPAADPKLRFRHMWVCEDHQMSICLRRFEERTRLCEEDSGKPKAVVVEEHRNRAGKSEPGWWELWRRGCCYRKKLKATGRRLQCPGDKVWQGKERGRFYLSG